MDIIEMATILTLLVTVIALWFAVINSKGYINKQIEKLTQKIQKIEFNRTRYLRIGEKPWGSAMTKEDFRIEKLQKKIEKLRRRL